jgi:hypothetical protein
MTEAKINGKIVGGRIKGELCLSIFAPVSSVTIKTSAEWVHDPECRGESVAHCPRFRLI